ncbi:general stress protein [Floricoccus tropicus]|uniref:General stress protein n=1 Tax=Floricoccus tropicus TaxID=1859473 RepID=A0A1E8GPL9_9LACT|nr:CvfD/Ygs/GSP13 family RNA-binding post-transcriptional regulator [Floricoccus tropicus]OFI49976.1 general stress protein [Floricoccus tropicus]
MGDIVDITITGVQNYGAFVKFNGDCHGLIHISEIKSGYTKNIMETVEIGQKAKAQIIDIDEYTGKISLSLRTLEDRPQTHVTKKKRRYKSKKNQIGFESLANQLDKWVEENTEYLKSQSKKG